MMMVTSGFEFPPKQQRALKVARRLEWVTLVYMSTAIVLMYFVLGSSQAMKTAWIEDILSLIPPDVFLIATHIAAKRPDQSFPYGYHRVVSVAFLCASLALLTMGIWLLLDASIKLLSAERPSIGGVTIGGETFWLGWLMIPALVYSGFPAVVVGLKKLPLAKTLHDKVLYVDAMMNKADWMTATAAIIGVLGIGLGYWWADAAAAAIISLDIVHDGYVNLRQVTLDLMDRRPRSVDQKQDDPLPETVQSFLEEVSWVQAATVRLREHGHVYFGEAYVQPRENVTNLLTRLEETTTQCHKLDWRIHDLVIVLVQDLPASSHRRPTGRIAGQPAARSP